MLCRMDDCSKSMLDGRPFFCKSHWAKVPRKIKSALDQAYDVGEGSITVVHLDQLILKAKFSLKVPNGWERRADFALSKLRKKAEHEKVLIITGIKNKFQTNSLWYHFNKVARTLNFINNTKILTSFSNAPEYKIAIILGEAGYKQMLPPYKVKHGLVHGGNVVVTPEKYLGAQWKHRPSQGSYSDNTYVISCEAHPEEYDEFGPEELAEIKRCLTWAKNLRENIINGFKKIHKS